MKLFDQKNTANKMDHNLPRQMAINSRFNWSIFQDQQKTLVYIDPFSANAPETAQNVL
tara:strand:+ start:453 stop:626 length:174 start_codon:yes stop_codon:yes gene_type:complete